MSTAVLPPPTPPELPEEARPRWPGGTGRLPGRVCRRHHHRRHRLGGARRGRAVGVPRGDRAGRCCSTARRGRRAAVRVVRAPASALALRLAPGAALAAVGWAALGLLTFYVFAAVYTVVAARMEQTVAGDLGADQEDVRPGRGRLHDHLRRPFAEEFFFRGFFYGALRTRFTVLVAALINGVLFGAIHYEGQRRAADHPAAGRAGVRLPPRLRADAHVVHGDRAPLDQQLDRLRGAGRRRGGLGGVRPARCSPAC